MTTYKIYWIDSDGFKGYTFVEVADTWGRKKAQEAKEKFFELGYSGNIVRVVKDC